MIDWRPNKNLTLEQALHLHRHEQRRFRRAGEEYWLEVHEKKIIRANGSHIRGITVEDVVAKDWEMESIYRQVSADELRDAFLGVMRENEGRNKSPMELLHQTCVELELL